LPKENGLHSFANTTGKYHLMGCILTAASARKWWLENILDSKDYSGSDKESENAVQKSINELQKGRTSIPDANKLKTIDNSYIILKIILI
jgi:hypothetical protein